MSAVRSAQQYQPATFHERGVAVPFTTPLLGGTRVRAAHRPRLELVVRNAAGGRGVYIMPWTVLTTICRPTLHDKLLIARISTLDQITPATVRIAARAMAAEGLAGEQAMAAVQAASASDDRQLRYHNLLVTLTHQVSRITRLTTPRPTTPPLSSPGLSSAAEEPTVLDARAEQTIAWLSSNLRQPATWFVGALEAIGDIMISVMPEREDEPGRLSRLIAMLRVVREDIATWSRTQRRGVWVSCAHMIIAMAEVILSLATTALAQARLIAEDLVGLLRVWAVDPKQVIRLAARPEWVLDGWEQICLIWSDARDDASRCAALFEIMEHVPIMPGEVSEWGENWSDRDNPFLMERPIGLTNDWRNGASVFDLIARNELFRAIAS